VRRLLAPLIACVLVLAAFAPSALAHAVVTSSTPAAGAQLTDAPAVASITFSEPVQLLDGTDIDVVDAEGNPAVQGPGSLNARNARVLEVPLRSGLPDGTYTLRYRVVSEDAHVIGGYVVFSIGDDPPGEPFLGGAVSSGPSETSPWAVSARFLELVGLGGLLGLLAFRWLVWRPAWGRAGAVPDDEREAALAWGRDAFWVAFGCLAVGSMLAEGYLLVTKSASALGTSILGALADPAGIGSVLGSTRFGSLVQIRGALLFVLFGLGVWQFIAEFGSDRSPRAPRVTGAVLPAAIMAGLLLVVLGGISWQGHASQAPWSTLQVVTDAVHLSSVSVWIGGLAFTTVALLRLPRVAPAGGPALAGAVLARFSRIALAAVSVAVATGVLRATAQLSDPAQLWDTSYGRSIIYKLLLLCPIALLALRNRKVVTALRGVARPNRPTLRMVRRTATVELVLSLAVVVVASLLVAQVPGRV
jgi:copper transport protein